MPKFRYSDASFELPPCGTYVAQVVKAEKTTSKKGGNEMIALTLHTLPDKYRLQYYLVFNGKNDGLITQFCKYCEGELRFPKDPKDDFSLTPEDLLYRLVFIEVSHEPSENGGEPRAKIELGEGILSRAKALARKPDLERIKLPANVPAPKDLAILPPGNDDNCLPF